MELATHCVDLAGCLGFEQPQIERGRRVAPLLEMDPVAKHDCPGEHAKSWGGGVCSRARRMVAGRTTA